MKVRSPFNACRASPKGEECIEMIFRELKNPYYIEDDPALTQTCGWLDAWTYLFTRTCEPPSSFVTLMREGFEAGSRGYEDDI